VIPALLLALAPAPTPPGLQEPLVLHADAVLRPDGSLLADGRVLLRGDTILAVGLSVPMPAGVRVLRLHGVLAPGFVDAFTSGGTVQPLREDSRRLTPALRAGDAVDPEADFWGEALAHGITAALVVPDPVRVVAGRAAPVPTAAPAPAGEGPVVLSLAPSSFRDEVLGPTSLPGGLALLRGWLAALDGRPREGFLVWLEDAPGARAALALLGEGTVPAGFLLLGDPGAYGGLLAGRRAGLRAPGMAGLDSRTLETWRRLHAAGVRLAFGTAGGPPAALRESAMALARATGDPAGALAAVTSTAADLAGLGRRHGRLAPGARADLVLWSAHPLDAGARVLGVMVGGRTVHTAPPVEEP